MSVKENMNYDSMERKVPQKNRGRRTQSIFLTKAVFKSGRGGASIDEDDLNSAFSKENYKMLKEQFESAPTDAKDYFI